MDVKNFFNTNAISVEWLMKVISSSVPSKFWHFQSNSHHPAHPTAVHGDIEQGVLRGHFLRFAGGVVGSDQQSRRQRGVRDGGGHREDHATVNSALWKRGQKHTSRCTDMKRSGNKKVKNLRRRLIMRAKVSYSLSLNTSLDGGMFVLNFIRHKFTNCMTRICSSNGSNKAKRREPEGSSPSMG